MFACGALLSARSIVPAGDRVPTPETAKNLKIFAFGTNVEQTLIYISNQ